jgi:hypothetical protein
MDGRTVTLDDVRGWPATVSMADAARALRISKSHGYQLARDDKFPCGVLHLGGSVRVITASLVALLEGAVADA